MATRLCYDAHIFGKNTIALYRNLFSFTHSLVICAGDQMNMQANPNLFKDLYTFLEGVNPSQDANNTTPLSLDFQALP